MCTNAFYCTVLVFILWNLSIFFMKGVFTSTVDLTGDGTNLSRIFIVALRVSCLLCAFASFAVGALLLVGGLRG